MFHSKKAAVFIANILQEAGIIPSKNLPVYIYCYEYIFDMLTMYVLFLSYALAVRKFFIGILFLTIFFLLRNTCGGFHAPGPFSCAILSMAVYLCSLYFIPYLQDSSCFLLSSLYVISITTILFLAPVDTPNKRLNAQKKKILRKNCHIRCIFLSAVYVLFLILKIKSGYATMTICVIIVSAGLLIGKWKNRKGETDDF